MPKSRGNGEAMYRPRNDGRWEGRIRLGFDERGKPRRLSYYGKTKGEVQKKVEEAKSRFNKNLPVIVNAPTMEAFLTDWLAGVKERVRPATYRSYEQIIRNHITPSLGKTRVDRLTPQQVYAFLTQKHLQGLSAEHLHRVLRAALNNAVRFDLAARNVASLVTAPRKQKKEMGYLNNADANTFLETAKGHRLEALFTVGIACGLRLGEVIGLKWKDIDLDAGVLKVEGQLQRVEGKLTIVSPKTAKARRTLTLPAFVIQSLRAHRAQQAQERLYNADRWQDNGFVFCSSHGTPLDGRNVARLKDSLLKRAGLPRIRFHDLRHTSATLLLQADVPARVVMEFLGHSQIGLTMNTYSHVMPEMLQEAATKMDALFKRPEQAS